MLKIVVSDLPRYRALIKDRPTLIRSIVLKTPGDAEEKGVLLLYFECNWARLLLGLSADELRWIDKHYHLILSTSWSPTDYAALALACESIKSTIRVQSCNYLEIPYIERFNPRLRCLNSLPCDWINPEHYPAQIFETRDIDIVMVANWGEFKRHWEFFEALTEMPENLKIVLIGQKEGGRNRDFILAQARSAGVRQQISAFESIPIAEVTKYQQRSKISVIMSRREGCCVAAVESLFAGCALAMRSDAHVGPLHYINNETGAKLRPGRIAEDLMELLDRAPGLRPREWAIENISCFQTAEKLNADIRDEVIANGGKWSRDIIVPQWRPYPTFINEADRDSQRPAYEELHRLFPNVFPFDLLDESWR
jgi:glycosyltransferase involved in cell wall biosynthesis